MDDYALQALYYPGIESCEKVVEEASQGTYDWPTTDPVYETWLQQRGSTLWIQGKPGAGKSTMIETAVRSARKRERRNEVAVAAFFFHGQGTIRQKSPLGLWSSIARQIFSKVGHLREKYLLAFQKREETHGPYGAKWSWTVEELLEFFQDMEDFPPDASPIEIYIDGVGEAGESTAMEVVADLQRMCSMMPETPCPIKVCFSCRRYPTVEFEHDLFIVVEDETHLAISLYIETELQQFQDTKLIASEIKARSGGVFLWACLVVKDAVKLLKSGKNVEDVQREVREKPRSLYGYYESLIYQIPAEDRSKASLIVQWLCFSGQPLSLEEYRFVSLCDIESPYSSIEAWKNSDDYIKDGQSMEIYVQDLLKGLTEVITHPNETMSIALDFHSRTLRREKGVKLLRFIHQSVYDFFVDRGLVQLGLSSALGSVEGLSHRRISRSCLKYLKIAEVQRDIVKHECFSHDRFDKDGQYPLIKYAQLEVFPQAIRAERTGVSLEPLIDDFQWPLNKVYDLWCRMYHDLPAQNRTILDELAQFDLLDFTKKLLERGGEIGAQIVRQTASIHKATSLGRNDFIRLLLDHGANVNIKGYSLSTALQMASRHGSEETVRLLLEYGADVNAQGGQFDTALQGAAFHHSEAVVRLLIDRGADVNAQGGEYGDALQAAAFQGKIGVVRLLLENGARLDPDGGFYDAGVQEAMDHGVEQGLRALMEKGADGSLRERYRLLKLDDDEYRERLGVGEINEM